MDDSIPILVNPHLEQYQPFHDPHWVDPLTALNTNAQAFRALFVLNASWVMTSKMFSLPFTFMAVAKALGDGALERRGEGLMSMVKAMKTRIATGRYGLTNTKTQEIVIDLNQVESDIKKTSLHKRP